MATTDVNKGSFVVLSPGNHTRSLDRRILRAHARSLRYLASVREKANGSHLLRIKIPPGSHFLADSSDSFALIRVGVSRIAYPTSVCLIQPVHFTLFPPALRELLRVSITLERCIGSSG